MEKLTLCRFIETYLPLRTFSCCLCVFRSRHICASNHNNMGNAIKTHRMLRGLLPYRSEIKFCLNSRSRSNSCFKLKKKLTVSDYNYMKYTTLTRCVTSQLIEMGNNKKKN